MKLLALTAIREIAATVVWPKENYAENTAATEYYKLCDELAPFSDDFVVVDSFKMVKLFPSNLKQIRGRTDS